MSDKKLISVFSLELIIPLLQCGMGGTMANDQPSYRPHQVSSLKLVVRTGTRLHVSPRPSTNRGHFVSSVFKDRFSLI